MSFHEQTREILGSRPIPTGSRCISATWFLRNSEIHVPPTTEVFLQLPGHIREITWDLGSLGPFRSLQHVQNRARFYGPWKKRPHGVRLAGIHFGASPCCKQRQKISRLETIPTEGNMYLGTLLACGRLHVNLGQVLIWVHDGSAGTTPSARKNRHPHEGAHVTLPYNRKLCWNLSLCTATAPM